MRTHQHVSFLHGLAIVGAVIVAGTVGLLMSIIEDASRDLSSAGKKQEQLERLVDEGLELVKVIDGQAPEVPRSGPLLASVTIERWRQTLERIGRAPTPLQKGMLGASLDSLDRLGPLVGPSRPEAWRDASSGTTLESLRAEAITYLGGLTQANQVAVNVVRRKSAELGRRRQLALLSAAVLGIVFLGAIEHSRYWTMRRLVNPVEELAGATVQALTGGAPLPEFEQCGTQELNTLAEMLASFVETLKRQVRERTAELERHKEQLEHEVFVRRGTEEQLRHAVLHDQLTGLCNRVLLLDRLDRCIERAQRCPDHHYALLFLDIDRFKDINDSLGHAAGDELLVHLARRLEADLRKTDTLSRPECNTVARIGGDEFVILLDGIRQPSDATVVGERLQKLLAEAIVLEGANVSVTASIGIASSELAYRSSADLLRDADIAMYQAKNKGKARQEVFNEQMLAEATGRLQLTNDLRQAIENTEFVLYYQPIVSLHDGRVAGFEALVRWQHPRRGLISPIDFIGHAEETGMIIPIGRWVLQEACRQLRAWRDEFGLDEGLSVSVNVSRYQLADTSLVSEVNQILTSVDVPGSSLNLEVTESAIMSNVDTVTEVLQQLRNIGVRIHIDDFGTGYSSLSCLHRFPLDVLKIDREFLGTMNASREFASVVDTVVVLAHNLNMEVVVEGVETRDQLAQLIAIDSDYGQGYYFSRPLPAQEVVQFLSGPLPWLQREAA